MADLTYFTAGTGAGNLGDVIDPGGAVISVSLTQIQLLNIDGSITNLNGSGLTFAPSGELLGGALTSVEHYDFAETTLLASLTGINLAATEVADALTFSGVGSEIPWLLLIPENGFPWDSATDTEMILQNTDGTFTRLTGTGFTFDPISGEVLGGVVTGAERLDTDGISVLDSRSIGPASLPELLTYFEDTVDAFGAALLGDNDTLTSADNDGVEMGGYAGNDTITGGIGDDTIEGGTGNDTLTGDDPTQSGSGQDVFLFDARDGSLGNDKITDFQVGTDKIYLKNPDGVAFFDDLSITASGSDALVTTAEGTILLKNVNPLDLDAYDFTIETVETQRGWTDIINLEGRVLQSSSTRFVMENTDASQTIFEGSGFGVNSNGFPVTGTITSVSRADRFGQVLLTVTNDLPSFDDLDTDFFTPIASLRTAMGTNWLRALSTSVLAESATQITLENVDGTRTVVNGTGLNLSNGALAGTVTSMQHLSAGGASLLTEITGLTLDFALALAAVASRGKDSVLNNAFFSYLLEGDNSWTAVDTGGFDTYYQIGSLGNDTYNASGSADVVEFSDSFPDLTVDLGAGTITGAGINASMTGIYTFLSGEGNDVLTGSNQADLIEGGDGADRIVTLGGDDTVLGDYPEDGGSSDTIDTGGGNDSIDGRGGDDIIRAGSGIDTVVGEDGNDNINAGNDGDIVYGGDGDDTARGAGGNDTLFGGADEDEVWGGIGFDTLFGGSGNDTAYGQGDADTLSGDAGDDILNGGSGDDVIYGGDDEDVLSGNGNSDMLYGDDGDDVLRGAAASDTLFGGAGNDSVFGGDARDTLFGGTGDDRLNGGGARDFFVFTVGDGSDQVTGIDLSVAGDRLQFDSALWSGVPGISSGTDVVTNFAMMTGATSATFTFAGGEEVRVTGGVSALSDLFDNVEIV